MTQLEIHGLNHRFGELEVISGLDASAPAGTVLGVVGPSGCGKSTLLEIVAGLIEPASGRVEAGEARTGAERMARCAYMPQRDLLLPWLSAIDNAALALRVAGSAREAAREAAHPLFARFGLEGFERSRPAELSGGMRQRVAFLRTLLIDRPVLLLDEPFASLDAITRAEMQQWLAAILSKGAHTTLLVTHDVEEALYLSDQVLVLSRRPATVLGRLAAHEPRAEDRAAAITTPAFAELKQRALRLLAGETIPAGAAPGSGQ